MKEKRKRAALLLFCLLLQCSFFGGHMRLAWWSTLYPQSLYETGIADADEAADDAEDDATDDAAEKKTEPVRVRCRLAEWLQGLFAD